MKETYSKRHITNHGFDRYPIDYIMEKNSDRPPLVVGIKRKMYANTKKND